VGAFFEGGSSDMVKIMERLIKFPEETLIFPGHEYALNFLPNAFKLDKENHQLKIILEWAQECKNKLNPAAPSSIGQELICNMYMRSVIKDGLKGFFQNVDHEDKIKLIEAVYDTV
jgi:hydroxyacylglutathione hydrolase